MADTNWYPSWYVVQTRTNYESKVVKNIEQLVKYRKMQDEIFDVKIISSSQVQIKIGDYGEWMPIIGDWKNALNLQKNKKNIQSVKIDAKVDGVKSKDVWVENAEEWISGVDNYIEKLIESVEKDANSVFSLENDKKDSSKFRKFKIIIRKCDNNDYVDETKVEFRIVEIKKFPCYVFVRAKTVLKEVEVKKLGETEKAIVPALSDFAWQIIKEAGNTFFVGPNGEPAPLSDDEIKKYGIEKVVAEFPVKLGDMVTILPPVDFAGEMGLVNSIDTETGMIKIGLFNGLTVEISVYEVSVVN